MSFLFIIIIIVIIIIIIIIYTCIHYIRSPCEQ
jgi:hypothetical protein